MKTNATFFSYFRSAKNVLLLLLGGLLAGICNGLLGAGGGIVLVLIFSRLLPKEEESLRSVYANALLVMLPLSCVTLYRYISSGSLVTVSESEYGGMGLMIGAIVGGAAGGFFLGRVKSGLINKIFAALTLISGVILLMR